MVFYAQSIIAVISGRKQKKSKRKKKVQGLKEGNPVRGCDVL